MIQLDLSILNQKGTPMFNSDIFANRPAAGIAGRIFISTDTLAIFRDTGSTWTQLGGGGGGGTINGSIAAGQIAFGTALNTIGGNNNLFWDNSTGRLGINTTTPTDFITINSNVNSGQGVKVVNLSTGNIGRSQLVVENNAGENASLSIWGTGTGLSNKTLFVASKDFQIGTDANIPTGGTSNFQIWVGGFNAATNPQFTLFSNGNLALNTTTNAGYKLDVAGSGRYTDNLLISKNGTGTAAISIINTTASATSSSQLDVFANTTAGGVLLGKYSSSTNTYKIISASNSYIMNQTAGDIAILNDFATGTIKFGAGATTTAHMTLFSNGNFGIGSTTNGGQRLQVTGTTQFNDTRTYSTGAAISFAIVKDITINSAISGGTGICNYVSTGNTIIQSSRTVPDTTALANIYPYNKYQFSSAGLTLTMQQATPGLRTANQLYVQNVFGGTNNGTITHVAGIHISGFYNEAFSTITPIIPNAFQLVINDTGEFGHPFTFTNRWGIYQVGINDRNYLAGNLLLNSTTDTGQILQVNGAIRVNGQASGSAGGSSGNHLIINVDGTQYKIALLNP